MTRESNLTEDQVDKLALSAIIAREELAHAPYSEYRVGAALLHEDGEITIAGNIELKPTVVGLHAEQMAVAKAFEFGLTDVFAVCIAVPNDTPPCGICLQALSTIEPDLDVDIITYNTETDDISEYHLSNLLPKAYTPEVRHD